MSDPAKVLGFLNIAGDWVPDLIFVMGGAVVVTLIFTPLVVKRARPLLADNFSLPTAQTLDKRLVSGAVLFGVGWGLSGYCPGPAVVSLLYGYESTIVFCLAMAAAHSRGWILWGNRLIAPIRCRLLIWMGMVIWTLLYPMIDRMQITFCSTTVRDGLAAALNSEIRIGRRATAR